MFKRNCVVKYVDNFGVEHAANVEAESLFGAADNPYGPRRAVAHRAIRPGNQHDLWSLSAATRLSGQRDVHNPRSNNHDWLCKRARILDSNQVIDARDAIFKSLI